MTEKGLGGVLFWLDAEPWRYWACAWLCFSLLLVSAVLAFWMRRRINHPVVFAFLLGLNLFAFRWPVILYNRQLSNPDESQMLADALKLAKDPVYWRSVDGHTVGPLTQLPITAIHLAGVSIDYSVARTYSALLVWVSLLCSWLMLRRFWGDALARFMILPLAACTTLSTQTELMQFSSEHFPLATLSVASLLLIRETLPKVRTERPWRFLLAGLALGSLPFSKLQAVPPGLWVGLFGIAAILQADRHPLRTRLRLAAALVLGSLLVPLFFLGLVFANGLWPEFRDCYILGNLAYVSEGGFSIATALQSLWGLRHFWGDLVGFFAPMSFLLLVGGTLYPLSWSRSSRGFLVFSSGLLFASLYATLAPGRPFAHYLQLLFCPLVLTVGALLGPFFRDRFRRELKPDRSRPRVPFHDYAAIFLLVAVFALVSNRLEADAPFAGDFRRTEGVLLRRPVGVMLQMMKERGDSLAVWGWAPSFYIEAGLPSATRETNTSRQVYDSPQRAEYRRRYLADLQECAPAFFVDAVGGSGFILSDRRREAHEVFPELAAYVSARYRLVSDCEGVRLYVRRDRTLSEQALRTVKDFEPLATKSLSPTQ